MGRASGRSLFGFLNIDKPAGMTAHDVVAIVRKTVNMKQVGHGGTLDPMATGVLPIAVGKATRLIRFLEGDKTYLAEIRLGLTTTTDDVEGEPLSTSEFQPKASNVMLGLATFIGKQKQLPPMYSAIHVGGKRLYELAREGKQPESVPERDVIIYNLDPLSYKYPFIKMRVKCSAGTYIRSIARDLGQKLECGGCLSSLRREQAGSFSIKKSVTLDELRSAAAEERLEEVLMKPEEILDLDSYNISEQQAQQLLHGQCISLPSAAENRWSRENVMALYEGRLVAICRRAPESDSAFVKIQPEVVVANADQAG